MFSMLPAPLLGIRPPTTPAGLPGELLQKRPDVAEAEQNLVASNAQVGVAVADFYPVFTLTGSAGFESATAQNIFDWRSKFASLGPGVSVPLFEGGRLRNNLRYAKASYREFLAAYMNAVLIAYADVEDALVDLHALSDEVARYQEAVASAQNYLRVARVQYKQRFGQLFDCN